MTYFLIHRWESYSFVTGHSKFLPSLNRFGLDQIEGVPHQAFVSI